MTKTEDFYCFPTDNKDFYTRFNFRRIVEEKPSADVLTMIEGKSIAVHLHLFYPDLLPEIVSYLNNIPCRFDLFVSIPEQQECDTDEISTQLHKIEFIGNIKIVRTPNRGRDVAPMLCTFKEELVKYDFMLHIHSKKSPHNPVLEGWRDFIFNHILRSKENVSFILQLLASDTGIVSPPDFIYSFELSGWTSNLAISQQTLNRLGTIINLEQEVPIVKFPQGTMFWCKTTYLKELWSYNWTFNDFPEEPIHEDGTIAHAIERLLFLFGKQNSLKCCMIYNSSDERELRARVEEEEAHLVHTVNTYQESFDIIRRKRLKYRRLTFIFAILFIISTLCMIVSIIY